MAGPPRMTVTHPPIPTRGPVRYERSDKATQDRPSSFQTRVTDHPSPWRCYFRLLVLASRILGSRSRTRTDVVLPRASALLALLAAVAIQPGFGHADRAGARALVEEGQKLATAGRSAAAIDHLVRAIDEDPDYLPAYEAAVKLWLPGEEWGPIIQHLARVTLRHPRYAFGWYTLAFAYRRTGRHDLAVLCYRQYIELRPDEADPYFGLAMSLMSQNRGEEAAAALEGYLARERRPSQREFVARARRELARLRGPDVSVTPGHIAWELLARALERARHAARAAGRALSPR